MAANGVTVKPMRLSQKWPFQEALVVHLDREHANVGQK